MDEASLLAAIVASPDDDAPRLVFADWLQDQGDPRGELIQVQCQRRRMLRERVTGEPLRRVLHREQELLSTHGRRFAAAYPSWMAVREWERGFPALVELDRLEDAFEHARELATMPPIAHLALARDGGRVGFSPGWRHLYLLKAKSSSSDSGPVTYYETQMVFALYQVASRAQVREWSGLSYWDDAGGGHEAGRIVGWGFSPEGDRFLIRWKDRTVTLELAKPG